jgi:hypothetical protein
MNDIVLVDIRESTQKLMKNTLNLGFTEIDMFL